MNSLASNAPMDTAMLYQIRVQGKLDESWSDWFDGMAIAFERRCDGSHVTILTGEVVDQAALHGVLNRVRDLNMLLLSVQLMYHGTGFAETPRE